MGAFNAYQIQQLKSKFQEMKNKFGFSSQELNLETRVRNAGEPCE
jgi:hypothetical protein